MTGKKLLDTILLALMLLSTVAVIGLFYYTEKVYKRPPIDEAKEKEAFFKNSAEKNLPAAYFKLDKMTISLVPTNPTASQRMKYIEVEIQLVMFKSNDAELVKAYLPMILDKIIVITSKMGATDLNSLTGKILLEDRLKKAINAALGKLTIKNIFFSRYVVQ